MRAGGALPRFEDAKRGDAVGAAGYTQFGPRQSWLVCAGREVCLYTKLHMCV